MDIIFFNDKNDKNEWNKFVLQNSNSFLQSFEWGILQQKAGRKVIRLRVAENNEVLAQAQVMKESSLSKNYFYISFGPIFKKEISGFQKEKSLETMFNKLKELAIKESCIFLRIEPVEPIAQSGEMVNYTFGAPPRRVQPQKTLILDITKPEDELFKKFSGKTRYNIGLAERSGVKIKEQENYSRDFYNLLQKTKNRQEFGIYSEDHYKDIFGINDEFIKVKLFFAEYNNKMINATIVLFFNDRAVTLHSGSDYDYRNVKGSNILRWEIILSAKRKGFKQLDFWGIDEKRWPNLTSFKKGFGGEEIEYPRGIDVVFQSFWYTIYKIIKSIDIKWF